MPTELKASLPREASRRTGRDEAERGHRPVAERRDPYPGIQANRGRGVPAL